MTFTYDASSATTRNKLRLIIADTDTVDANKQIFTDEELDLFISTFGSDLNTLAAHCYRSIAGSSARIATRVAIGGGDINSDRTQVAAMCLKMAEAHDKRSEATPYATEVAVEDKEISYVDNFRDDDSQEIDLTDLNT